MLTSAFNRTASNHLWSKPILILGFQKTILVHIETEIAKNV